MPKISHNFSIGTETKKLSDFVIGFEKKEKEHIEICKQNKQEIITPYTWRVQGDYISQNRRVILLFFRLKKSKKVSVIYSTHIDIHGKTLRHHWFNRTYIEQFFKLLKHSMKIQNTIVRSKDGFEKKLYQFMFLGFYLQFFVRYVRSHFDFGLRRKIGLEGLKRQTRIRDIINEILDDLLQTK